MTYGYCVYHEIECDYKGGCIDCPHNTEEDTEWFKQDDEKVESGEQSMDGYDLADEVFRNIGLNENHEISLNDTIRYLGEIFETIYNQSKFVSIKKTNKWINIPHSWIRRRNDDTQI